jgi:hypothetical protein
MTRMTPDGNGAVHAREVRPKGFSHSRVARVIATRIGVGAVLCSRWSVLCLMQSRPWRAKDPTG